MNHLRPGPDHGMYWAGRNPQRMEKSGKARSPMYFLMGLLYIPPEIADPKAHHQFSAKNRSLEFTVESKFKGTLSMAKLCCRFAAAIRSQ